MRCTSYSGTPDWTALEEAIALERARHEQPVEDVA
jgi:hypothetical protein